MNAADFRKDVRDTQEEKYAITSNHVSLPFASTVINEMKKRKRATEPSPLLKEWMLKNHRY